MPPANLGTPTVLFLALLALAALVLAFLALSRANAVNSQLQSLEAELERLRERVTAQRTEVFRERPLGVEVPPAPETSVVAPLAMEPPALDAAPALAASALPDPAMSATVVSEVSPVELPPVPPSAPAPPPPPRISLEERIGARLPVWIGSIALALAGAFLVKYSFDQGLLSPLVRVVLGVAFGVGLLLLGEFLRRSSPGVAQGLSAAGVADLFACFLAGVHLYGLIPPAFGFVLMALTTAVAVALALRQGPMVALIGLVGGFLTPFWIQTGEPDARALFGYLLLLQVGLLAVARRRGWAPIAALSMAGGLVWVFVWLAGPRGMDATWLGLFVVLSSAVAVATVLARPRSAIGGAGAAGAAGLAGGGPMLWGSLGLGLVAIAIAAQRAGHSPIEWGLFGLLAAGLLVLGRAEPAFEGLAWLAAAAGVVLLATWSPIPAELPRFLGTAFGLELLFGLGASAAALVLTSPPGWRVPPRPGRWTALAGSAVLAVFLVALATVGDRLPGFSWGLAALLHGLAFVAGTALVLRRAARRGTPVSDTEAAEPAGARDALRAPAAGLAAAATAFVSLALPLELERAWLSVAWALEVPALLWLAGRFRLPVLTWLARLAAVLVLARLLFNPLILDYPIGEGILVNWLLYGYGVPLAAFAAGAFLARRALQPADRRTAFGLELGGVGLAFALVGLEICQAFHPGKPLAGEVSLAQWATLTVAWLGLAWLALELAERLGERPTVAASDTAPDIPGVQGQATARTPLRSLELGGWILVLVALCGLAGQLLVLNPLWHSQSPVGAMPILNLLLWAYGAPAVLLLLLSRRLAGPMAPAAAPGEGPPRDISWWLARILASAGLVLLFVLVTLEVRQLFHGSRLDVGTYGAAERYAYSAAWILFGTALLALGIARRGRGLRYAALAVMTAAVFKVFLYDTSNLTGLYRVFSFLGLGAALLLLAWVYQRFVFRPGAVQGSQIGAGDEGAGRTEGVEEAG